jgi:hypothetical protein
VESTQDLWMEIAFKKMMHTVTAEKG